MISSDSPMPRGAQRPGQGAAWLTHRWSPFVAWALATLLGYALFAEATSSAAGMAFLGDLTIYRESVRSAARGASLYDYVFHQAGIRPEGFGFTYPPSAALFFWLLIWVPVEVGNRLWTLAALATAAVIAVILARRSTRPEQPRRTAVMAGLCATLLIASFPVVSDLLLGQVSLFVMALTLVDAVVVPPRWRGWLTAVAGAIKLLPLAYIPYFLLTRQWAAAARTTIGFGVATLLAFVVLPGDSLSYWTTRLWQTGNVGDPASPRNRALYGALVRWWGEGASSKAAWGVLVVLLVVMAGRAILRHHRAGESLQAATVVGCLSIAAFPISWTHYLTWALVAAWLLATSQRLWPLVGAVAIVALSLLSPLMSEETPTQLWMSLSQELPGLFVALVASLGLPRTAGTRKPCAGMLP